MQFDTRTDAHVLKIFREGFFMFSYYGSKSKVVNYYPPPKFNKIIEPFAGSARYSLKYWQNDITIVDKYDVIVKIWKYLQQSEKTDIIDLHEPKLGETITMEQYKCEGAFLLMSYVIKSGTATPAYTVCKNRGEDGQISNIKKTIANQLFKIKHWKIIHGSYEDLENEEATWFIDPPYQFGGEYYKESTKNIDFKKLAEWCKTRNGQVIVCENTKATWLPFKPMKEMYGSRYKTTEAIWSNHKTNYDAVQLSLQF